MTITGGTGLLSSSRHFSMPISIPFDKTTEGQGSNFTFLIFYEADKGYERLPARPSIFLGDLLHLPARPSILLNALNLPAGPSLLLPLERMHSLIFPCTLLFLSITYQLRSVHTSKV